MYFTVYKITNTMNDMVYVGVHRTKNLDDGYMGSGQLLKRAQKKYGLSNFSKVLLAVYTNRDDMFDMESLLVNEQFVRSKNTYNIKLGGEGGPHTPKNTNYYKSGDHYNNFIKSRIKARAAKVVIYQKRIDEYDNAPNTCKQCNNTLEYKKRKNAFCNRSCAASFNNTGTVVSDTQKMKTSKSLKTYHENH